MFAQSRNCNKRNIDEDEKETDQDDDIISNPTKKMKYTDDSTFSSHYPSEMKNNGNEQKHTEKIQNEIFCTSSEILEEKMNITDDEPSIQCISSTETNLEPLETETSGAEFYQFSALGIFKLNHFKPEQMHRGNVEESDDDDDINGNHIVDSDRNSLVQYNSEDSNSSVLFTNTCPDVVEIPIVHRTIRTKLENLFNELKLHEENEN